MVCSIGSGRMAVMARLLEAGSLSQAITEEVGHQKLGAQYIYRELRDADEANLLDEEDMHVFELKPMADQLHLVCCNACKKPVKASQYVAHAEFCRSLNSTKEIILELDSGRGHKKPPRKERKKLQIAHASQATTIVEQEKSDLIRADGPVTLQSQLDGKIGITSPFYAGTKSCVVAASVRDGSRVCSGDKDYSRCAMPRPSKRSKLISSEQELLSNDLEEASGVIRNTITPDMRAYNGFVKRSMTGCETLTRDCVVGNKRSGKLCNFPTKDVPVPLATKIYYSQRNNRLRSALGQLYFEASSYQLCHDSVTVEVSEENIRPLQQPSQNESSVIQIDKLPNSSIEKRDVLSSLPSQRKSDQNLAQSSEASLGKSGGILPITNFSNQSPVDNVVKHQTPAGLMRSKYFSNPYPFAGNSGIPLGAMQQPNGSVPVT